MRKSHGLWKQRDLSKAHRQKDSHTGASVAKVDEQQMLSASRLKEAHTHGFHSRMVRRLEKVRCVRTQMAAAGGTRLEVQVVVIS